MSHIFICYSLKDKAYVHQLQKALEDKGFDVWIDNRFDYGEKWSRDIQQRIDECSAFIVILSTNSKQSEWVQREVLYAIQKNKPIFPLLLEGDLWMLLQDRNYVDVTDKSLPNESFFRPISRFVPSSTKSLQSERETSSRETSSRSFQVFLCSSPVDKRASRSLYQRLNSDGVKVWLDSQSLLPGQSWEFEVSKAIRTSDVAIICLSKDSTTKSGYLHKELRYALDTILEKPEGAIYLLPVRLDDCTVPEILRRWQWTDLYYDNGDFDQHGYNRLIKSLNEREKRINADLLPSKEERKSFFRRLVDFLVGSSTNTTKKEYTEIIVEGNSNEALKEISRRLETDIKPSNKKEFDFVWNTKDIFADFPILNPLPILVIKQSDTSDVQVEKTKERLTKIPNPKGRIALLYLDCSFELFESLRAKFVEYGKTFAYDIIILYPRLAKEILRSDNPQKAMKQYVLSTINLNTISPYITTGPTPQDIFFGREHELREIENHINNVSYAVIGGRRIGKTSILNRLHKIRLPNAGFRTVFFDCSIIQDYESFMETKVLNWQPEIENLQIIKFRELLDAPPKGKPFVLLLDEADKLVPVDKAGGWKLFNKLRYLSNAKQIQVVLCGERILREALKDPQSPLFNFPNEILLGPLDYQAVKILITQPMKKLEIKLIGTDEITQKIWNFTSGHPNVIQRLCRKLIERVNQSKDLREVNIEMVDEVIQDVSFQRNDFLETYWENASTLEKIITLVMVNNKGATTLSSVRETIAQHNITPTSYEVDQSLQRLIYLRAILKQTAAGYEFAVKSFPAIVANTITLQDMLEILSEKYRRGEE